MQNSNKKANELPHIFGAIKEQINRYLDNYNDHVYAQLLCYSRDEYQCMADNAFGKPWFGEGFDLHKFLMENACNARHMKHGAKIHKSLVSIVEGFLNKGLNSRLYNRAVFYIYKCIIDRGLCRVMPVDGSVFELEGAYRSTYPFLEHLDYDMSDSSYHLYNKVLRGIENRVSKLPCEKYVAEMVEDFKRIQNRISPLPCKEYVAELSKVFVNLVPKRTRKDNISYGFMDYLYPSTLHHEYINESFDQSRKGFEEMLTYDTKVDERYQPFPESFESRLRWDKKLALSNLDLAILESIDSSVSQFGYQEEILAAKEEVDSMLAGAYSWIRDGESLPRMWSAKFAGALNEFVMSLVGYYWGVRRVDVHLKDNDLKQEDLPSGSVKLSDERKSRYDAPIKTADLANYIYAQYHDRSENQHCYQDKVGAERYKISSTERLVHAICVIIDREIGMYQKDDYAKACSFVGSDVDQRKYNSLFQSGDLPESFVSPIGLRVPSCLSASAYLIEASIIEQCSFFEDHAGLRSYHCLGSSLSAYMGHEVKANCANFLEEGNELPSSSVEGSSTKGHASSVRRSMN